MALSENQMVEIAAIVAEARSIPSDTKGWIPTHDGKRTKDGAIRDPYIRNSDAHGPMDPYLPWFSCKGEANAWCKRVDAVPMSCEYGRAADIAHAHSARLIVA